MSLRERWQLLKLEVTLAKTQAAFRRDRKALAPSHSHSDIERLESRESFELGMIIDEMDEIRSNQLIRKSRHFDLPFPSRTAEDTWERSSTLGTVYLSDHGRHQLKLAIRDEKRYRREILFAYAGGLTSVLSLLVALAALGKDFWIWAWTAILAVI